MYCCSHTNVSHFPTLLQQGGVVGRERASAEALSRRVLELELELREARACSEVQEVGLRADVVVQRQLAAKLLAAGEGGGLADFIQVRGRQNCLWWEKGRRPNPFDLFCEV